ncbi:MAG TPA: Rrf2 family transcriptional regulator [Gemmatimonadales bacterium]|jgi:Rrf2 family protein|nr:Rrf2 family transcriptional regulator [Gemmatimonadales bacterium]
MRVTTWTEYSLIIALHLARRGSHGSEPVAARELSELERLPADYVEQILLRLRRAGLVESVRGARGGYFLAREAQRITVRDVMAASEHQTFEMNCTTHPVDAERCDPSSSCSIRPVWHALQRRVDEFLSGITLADLIKDQPPAPELIPLTSSTG